MIPFLIPFHHFDLQLLRKRRLPCPRRRQHFIRLLVRDLECFYMFTYFIVHASDKEFRSYCSSSYIVFLLSRPLAPTMAPSSLPSAPPTPLPTKMPSAKPSASPTRSFQPSQIPTVAPDLISWTTTQSGLLKDDRFGWHISDKGLTLTFIAEKSENCFEGSNANEQKGTASARIFVPEGKRLALNYTLGGVGESLDSGYEEMILFIDGVRMASSTSQAIGIECSTSPVLTTYEVEPPYIMKSGIYQLRVGFSTFDDFDHYGIEYMIQFAFL